MCSIISHFNILNLGNIRHVCLLKRGKRLYRREESWVRIFANTNSNWIDEKRDVIYSLRRTDLSLSLSLLLFTSSSFQRRPLSRDGLYFTLYIIDRSGAAEQMISVSTVSREQVHTHTHTDMRDWKHVFWRGKQMKDAARSADPYLLFH